MDKDKWALVEALAKSKGHKVERIARGLNLPPGVSIPIAIIIEERTGLCMGICPDGTKRLMTEKERALACRYGGDRFTLILPNLQPGDEDRQKATARHLVDRAKESGGTEHGSQ